MEAVALLADKKLSEVDAVKMMESALTHLTNVAEILRWVSYPKPLPVEQAVANIPKNLLTLMERAGLAAPERTMMGGAVADTYRFTAEGAQIVADFFHVVH